MWRVVKQWGKIVLKQNSHLYELALTIQYFTMIMKKYVLRNYLTHSIKESNKSRLNYLNTKSVWLFIKLNSLTKFSLTSVVLIKSLYSWQQQQGKVYIRKMGLNFFLWAILIFQYTYLYFHKICRKHLFVLGSYDSIEILEGKTGEALFFKG